MSVNQLEPAVPPQAEPAAPPATPESELAKKYGGDWGKANDGYFNVVKELKLKNETVNQLSERTQQLETAIALLMGGGQPTLDPSTALANELGLTSPQSLDSYVDTRLEQALQKLFGPLAKQVEAEDKLATEIENFEQYRSEARKFMAKNPEVSELFNQLKAANPVAAWKYAIRETIMGTKQPVGSPGAPSLPLSGSPGPMVPLNENHAQVEAEALKYGQDYGDMRPYRSARFKGTSIERAVQRALQEQGW